MARVHIKIKKPELVSKGRTIGEYSNIYTIDNCIIKHLSKSWEVKTTQQKINIANKQSKQMLKNQLTFEINKLFS